MRGRGFRSLFSMIIEPRNNSRPHSAHAMSRLTEKTTMSPASGDGGICSLSVMTGVNQRRCPR